MSKLAVIKAALASKGGRSLLLLKKFSPEILVVVGIVGVVTSTVMACKATIKAEDALEVARGKLDKIHIAKDTLSLEEYSGSDYKKDLAVTYAQTAVDFVVVYWKPVTLGVLSVACILTGHNILRQRNVALMAAYKAVEESYSNYRKRVVAKLGTDYDREFRFGVIDETQVEIITDENGNEIDRIEKVVKVINPDGHSEFSRFFDEASSQWSKDPGYNLAYLKGQQNFANDLLQTRGHVFLNEIYSFIGVPHSTAGAVVGWVLGSDGDNYIDFGIFDAENGKARDFVNGRERSILLDFNVDGPMYDKI